MSLQTLATEAEYQVALARVWQIFDAQPGTPEGAELEALSKAVEEYEDRVYPVTIPDTETMRRFRQNQEQAVFTDEKQ